MLLYLHHDEETILEACVRNLVPEDLYSVTTFRHNFRTSVTTFRIRKTPCFSVSIADRRSASFFIRTSVSYLILFAYTLGPSL